MISCFNIGGSRQYGVVSNEVISWSAKVVIKGVLSRSYCCYGNSLCHETDNNAFTNDWAFFDIMIVASSDK